MTDRRTTHTAGGGLPGSPHERSLFTHLIARETESGSLTPPSAGCSPPSRRSWTSRLRQALCEHERERRFGPYEVEGVERSGPLGPVLAARCATLDRTVCLRPLLMDGLGPQRRELLRLDVRAALTLEHPSIAKAHGLIELSGRAALISEAVPGEDLSTLLLRRRLGVNEAGAMARAVAGALDYAHERALPHGALTPHTVLLGSDGSIRVADFGLARLGRLGGLDPRDDLRALGRILLASLPSTPSEERCDASLAALAAADRLRRLAERCARGEVATASDMLRQLDGRPTAPRAPLQRAPLLFGAALVLVVAFAFYGASRFMRSAPPKGSVAPAARATPP